MGEVIYVRSFPENLDVIVYKDYMEGTLDFSDYSH